MPSNTSFFEKSNKQHLSELYFKAVGEKEVLRRDLEKDPYNQDKLLNEYIAIENLIDDVRGIWGTVVNSIP